MRSIAYRPAAMTPSVPLVVVATLLLAALPTAAAADKTLLVDVAARPGQPFASRPTRTLADFAHLPTDPPADRFGGQAAGTRNATGFFRTERCDGRWWIIDPDGGLFLCRGVNSIAASPTAAGRQAMERLFTNEAGWARATVAMLRTAGFNCVGSWSDHAALAAIERPMPQTRLWSFMAAYGRKRGGTFMQAGHVGYPNDCPFIFDPDFPAFCAEHARQLAAEKNSPWVLGHYTDNEMPWKRTLLDGYLGLPEGDPGRDAARSWLARRRGTSSDTAITDDDRSGFLEFAIDRYLAVVTAAIRRHDPNHLVLGPRLHEICFDLPEVFRACGRHCDVVAVNYYRAWTPDPQLIAMWTRESQRPFLVTEHYAKGVDSGMGNTSGAGWLVKTQQDRGRFYQNFAIGLLESRDCVGWFWHRYADNDPLDKKVDPSNRDSNKGIVSPTYDPWTPLVDEMTAFNGRVHGIVARLDGTAPAVAMPASRPITTVTAAREGDADERPERPSQQPERKKERVVVFPDDVRVDRDVAYLGPDRRQKADLYFPPTMPANRRLPAVVVIHGGGFNDGDKDRRREINIASHLARRGYVAMSIDYRLWSKGAKNPTWPQSLHDAKTAVRWLRQNAGRLGIDPDRIGAIGCSAGGNLASMLALTGPKDGLEPPDGDAAIPTRVRCAVNLYGAVDLLNYHDMKMFLKTRAEDPDSYRRASPISYCDKDDPPLLILHGTGDETVDVSQSRTLARALETAGAPHRLIEIPDAPHTFDLDYEAFDVKTPVFDFFDEHLAR